MNQPSEDVVAPPSRLLALRAVLGLAGVAAALFGAWGILAHQGYSPPLKILPWWIALVILHDGVIAPVTALVGSLVVGRLPAAARAPVQFAGVVCGLVTLFAVPLLWREGRGFEGSTLLTRDYRANLIGILATVIVLTAVVAVGRSRLRDHRLRR
jgi:hypothetical protein